MRNAEYQRGTLRTADRRDLILIRNPQSAIRNAALYILLLTVPLSASASSPWDPAQIVRAHILDQYPWAEADVAILQLSADPPVEKPSAVVVEKAPPGRSVFRLDFVGAESITMVAQVKAFDRVFMSRGAFRKGYVLRQEDVYSTLMESGRIPKGAILAEGGIIGKPLSRSIVPNVPLTDAMVSDGRSVKRGRKVVLAVESSAFTIRTMGEIKQDAVIGDYVNVVNLLSKKMVTGLLVDENTVRVRF